GVGGGVVGGVVCRGGEAWGGRSRHIRSSRTLPPRTLRRPEAARGGRTRHRAGSARIPVRRTAVQSGRQAACPDAGRTPQAAPAARRHHLRLCHARQVEAMTMADRIVIMLDGTLQQVGPPVEVYQKPANRFVAGFIGSPSMNFLPIRLESEGGKLQVKGHGFQITLPPDKAAALKGDGERDAVLGIRPENLLLRPPSAEESQLRATVEIVEAVG